MTSIGFVGAEGTEQYKKKYISEISGSF